MVTAAAVVSGKPLTCRAQTAAARWPCCSAGRNGGATGTDASFPIVWAAAGPAAPRARAAVRAVAVRRLMYEVVMAVPLFVGRTGITPSAR